MAAVGLAPMTMYIVAQLIQAVSAGTSTMMFRGIYHNNASVPAPRRTNASVVLYITTAASHQHWSYFECLPALIRTSPMLMKADVIVYVGNHMSETLKHNMNQLLDQWPVRNRIVHFGENPGKQEGAKLAAHVGFSSGWFRGYEWVIRINPDVVIYNDNLIWPLMQKAENWGIFVGCGTHCEPHSGCAPRQTHTDFFAVRPSRVPPNAFADWNMSEPSAEVQATAAFKDIYAAKADVYLPRHYSSIHCRVTGGGVFHSTQFCHDFLESPPFED
mmetsp:Transcript_88994/g.235421  ORF Transcript_88994/g.235421 Transcript_88994/m.235421 type:complete len:273 (+) Transcript_88994:120-938(+)